MGGRPTTELQLHLLPGFVPQKGHSPFRPGFQGLFAGRSLPARLTSRDAGTSNTNWSGVVAHATEFRRKGNILTASVRLRNTLTGGHIVQFGIGGVYLMDEAGAKSYQEDVGGAGITLWMKFPAPPLETKTATLAMPQMPPFEDLPIQDQ